MKDKWIVAQERGSDMPVSPAVFTLFRIFTDPIYGKLVGIYPHYCYNVILEMRQGGGKMWGLDNEFNNLFCNACYKAVKQDPKLLHKLRKKFEKLIPDFLKFCKQVYNTNLKKLSKKELWQLYNKYVKEYEKVYPYGEPVAFGSRYGLEEELRKYLENKSKQAKKQEKFHEYFEILITPPEIPLITKEQIELLKIAVEIKKQDKLRKLFTGTLKFILSEIKNFSKLNKKLEKHEKEFTWAVYDYGANLLTKPDFIRQLKDAVEGTPDQHLKKLQLRYKNLKKDQDKIIKELKIDSYHKKLFEALQVNSFLIDYKKEIFTLSHSYINKSLIKEIASRLNLSPEKTHLLLPKEMKQVLINNKNPNEFNLDERADLFVVHLYKGKYKQFQGKKAQDYLNKNNIIQKIEKITEVKGQPASPGIVKGPAKIIKSAKEINKLEKGDILITFMTTPAFMVGIKKAAAIVTNEGGISTHAAIISREFKIPCVIGTKHATEIFKDNDLVEVDANKGVIKKIK